MTVPNHFKMRLAPINLKQIKNKSINHHSEMTGILSYRNDSKSIIS